MRFSSLFLVSAAVLSLSLTACAEDPLASPAPESPSATTETTAPEPTEDPDIPSNADIDTFVSAIASSSPSELEAAKDLVLDESLAAGYLTYYSHNINSQIDAGFPATAEQVDVKEIDNGFEMCDTRTGERLCSTYTDFEGKDGLITDFKIQDRDLADRLAVGSGETISGPDGSKVQFVAAYMNAVDTHLLVAYKLHSGSSETNMPMASYRGENGRQSQSEEDVGAWSLAPDSMSSYISVFPGAQLGGEVHLEIWTENSIDLDTVVIPTDSPE